MQRIVLNEISYFGAGCRSMIADEARRRGYKKAFFVTDADLVRFGVASKIEEVFRGAGIPYEIFSDVKANPTIANVQNGVAAFKAAEADRSTSAVCTGSDQREHHRGAPCEAISADCAV